MAVAIFLLPFAVIGSLNAKKANKNDVKNWIPSQYQETQIYRGFRDLFTGEEFLLLSWDGCNMRYPKLDALAMKLLPPMEIYFRGEAAPVAAEDYEDAKIKIEERLAAEFRDSNPDSKSEAPRPHYGIWIPTLPEAEKLRLAGAPPVGKAANPAQLQNAVLANLPIVEKLYVFEDAKDAGDKPEDPNKPLAYATIVRDQNKLFKSVITGPRALRQIVSRNSNYTEEQAAEKLTGSLFGPRQKTADGRLIHKYIVGQPVDPDTGGLLSPEQVTEIPLEERQTCLVVTLSEKGLHSKKAAIDELKRIATDECLIPAEELRLGGPPVDNVAIDDAGQKSLNMLAGVAVLIGFVVSWVSLKNLKLVVIVISAGIYSAILSLSIVWWTGAPVDAILFTMPSLVYVATTSGAIHLSNYYRDVILEGHPPEGAGTAALLHAALPLGLATGTTAVGLATLCVTELVPIYYFGLYSAIGVLISALLLIFYIPAALELWQPEIPHTNADESVDALTHTHHDENGFWWRGGQWVLRHHALVATACLLVMGIAGYGLFYSETSVQLMRLLSPRERLLADYAYLEENLGPLVPMEVVVRVPKPTDEENADLKFYDRLEMIDMIRVSVEQIPEVGGSMSALTFMPDLDDLPAPRFVGNKRNFLNKQLLKHRDDLLSGDYLKDQINQEQPGQVNEVWRLSARVSALKNVDYARFIADLREHVEPVISGYLIGRQEDYIAGLEQKAASLPSDEQAPLLARLETEQAKLRTWQMRETLAAALPTWLNRNDFRGEIDVQYTGVVPLVYKAQHSLMDGLVFGFLTDFALIVIVMMIACRDWSAGIVLLLPSAFPAVIVFGTMGWIHHILQRNGTGYLFIDIGYVMAPSVALGVTVDDVVHFMLWFRKGIIQGMSRKESVELAFRGCARAMYQSWGVIGIGLAVFALSPFMPTRNFGIMMISMLTVALAGNLLMLPAVLRGPGGAVFAWGIKRKMARAALHAAAAATVAAAPIPAQVSAVPQADLTPGLREPDPGMNEEEDGSDPITVPLPVTSNEGSIPQPHMKSDALKRSFGR